MMSTPTSHVVTTSAPFNPEFALAALPKVRASDKVFEFGIILFLLFLPFLFLFRYFVQFRLLLDPVLFAGKTLMESVFFAEHTVLFLANMAVKLSKTCL